MDIDIQHRGADYGYRDTHRDIDNITVGERYDRDIHNNNNKYF